MQISKQFKILFGVIFGLALTALIFFSQFLSNEQVKELKLRVDQIQYKPAVVITVTPEPTATPSAAVKKVFFPTFTPVPSAK